MNMMQVKVFEPSNSTKKGFGSLVREMFKDFWSSRDLAWRLFVRDKKAEYRQSLLGILWAFITPLTNALIWIFLSASGAIVIPGTGIPYPLFVFLGTMIWSIFTESVNLPLSQTNAARNLISKINFPKEAILMSGFYKTLFNSGIKLIIVVLALIVFKINPGFNFLLFLLMLLFTIAFGISLGLVVAPFGMLYKDVGRAMPMALTFLMYLTPVVYKGTKISALQNFLDLNPLTPIVNSARNLATGGWFENPAYLIMIFFFMLIVGFIGWVFYRVSIPIIVERM